MTSHSGLLTTPSAQSSPPPITLQRSLWHSPVTYLFGGLAAMMALIVFALLILACSYWRLSRRLRNQGDVSGDVEAGDVCKHDHHSDKIVTIYEKMFVVVMAGDEEPTFLATPSSSSNSSRTSSFGSNSCRSSSSETEKDEGRDRVQVSTMGYYHESAEEQVS